MNHTPMHVAIIMDGNGRWGVKNRGNRILGHQAGFENIEKILNFFIKKKIKIVTLYSFSYDNWKRSKKEINNLFSILKNFYYTNFKKLIKKNIKLKIIGENKFLPKNILSIKKKINKIIIKNIILKVNIAFNYSSKLEILSALKKTKLVCLKSIDQNLYTYPDPNPNLIIRTGNRHRLSDFLLWQGSYSEIFFSKKLWPDFNINDLKKILKWYKNIQRNFGAAK